jgi:myosin-crossreactive antigen
MAFRKYQKVEKVEVKSQDDSERIREGVARLGKTSAIELTPDEKRKVLDKP